MDNLIQLISTRNYDEIVKHLESIPVQERQAYLNQQNEEGDTFLTVAFHCLTSPQGRESDENAYRHIITMLLEYGANPNVYNGKGEHIIIKVILEWKLLLFGKDVIRSLISHGLDINHIDTTYNMKNFLLKQAFEQFFFNFVQYAELEYRRSAEKAADKAARDVAEIEDILQSVLEARPDISLISLEMYDKWFSPEKLEMFTPKTLQLIKEAGLDVTWKKRLEIEIGRLTQRLDAIERKLSTQYFWS